MTIPCSNEGIVICWFRVADKIQHWRTTVSLHSISVAKLWAQLGRPSMIIFLEKNSSKFLKGHAKVPFYMEHCDHSANIWIEWHLHTLLCHNSTQYYINTYPLTGEKVLKKFSQSLRTLSKKWWHQGIAFGSMLSTTQCNRSWIAHCLK